MSEAKFLNFEIELNVTVMILSFRKDKSAQTV